MKCSEIDFPDCPVQSKAKELESLAKIMATGMRNNCLCRNGFMLYYSCENCSTTTENATIELEEVLENDTVIFSTPSSKRYRTYKNEEKTPQWYITLP